MESSVLQKNRKRRKRVMRVRKGLRGSALKPRLCVVKSNVHLYAQIIDDEAGVTLVSVSTLAKEFRDTPHNRRNKASAEQLGARIASLAKEKNISDIVFDRGFSKYHGVVASLADAARAGGLQF